MTTRVKILFILALCCFTCVVWLYIKQITRTLKILRDIEDDAMMHAFPPKLRCMYECILNETGIYSYETNSLNEVNLDEFLKTTYENVPDLIPVAKEAFQTCTEKQVEFLKREEEHHPGKLHTCKLFLLHCVKFRIFENCPESNWVKSTECDDTLDFMKNCKPPHLRSGPGHFGPHHGPPPPPPPPNDD